MELINNRNYLKSLFHSLWIGFVIVFSYLHVHADINTTVTSYSCPNGYSPLPSVLGADNKSCISNQAISYCANENATNSHAYYNCVLTSYNQGSGAAAQVVGVEQDCPNCAKEDSIENLINQSNGNKGSSAASNSGSCSAGTIYNSALGGCVNPDEEVQQCLNYASANGSSGRASVDRYKQCMGDSLGNSNSETQASSAGCDMTYQQLANACTDKAQIATNRCDENSDAGISSWAKKIESGTALAQGASNQVGINSACSQISTALAGANAAIASFKGLCEYNISSCQSSCQKAMEDASAKGCMDTASVQSSLSSCQALKSKAASIATSLQASMQNAQMAKACAQSSAGTLEALCRANPTMPGCTNTNTTDCSLAANANNLVCKCQANPFDAACGYNTNFAGGTTTQASQISRKSDSGVELGGLGFNDPQIDPVTGKGGVAAGAVGKQGGGVNLNVGGGSGGSGGGEGSGGGGSGISANILSGFRGGGAVGGMFGRGGSGGNGVRGSYGSGSGKVGNNGQPDLRQFLPGGSMYKRRGVSGSFAGPDGITGPHGRIWQKVNTRYKSLQGTLLP